MSPTFEHSFAFFLILPFLPHPLGDGGGSCRPGRVPAANNPQQTRNKQSRADGSTYWNVLSLGASGRGLPFHTHGDSWIATVHGSKRWLMYAPGQRPASERSHLLHNSVDWLKHELVRCCRCMPAPAVWGLPFWF